MRAGDEENTVCVFDDDSPCANNYLENIITWVLGRGREGGWERGKGGRWGGEGERREGVVRWGGRVGGRERGKGGEGGRVREKGGRVGERERVKGGVGVGRRGEAEKVVMMGRERERGKGG